MVGVSSHLGTLGIKKTVKTNQEEIEMDYREADAIWNEIVDKVRQLDPTDELYKVYKEACDNGRIEWEEMYKLRDALKSRNL